MFDGFCLTTLIYNLGSGCDSIISFFNNKKSSTNTCGCFIKTLLYLEIEAEDYCQCMNQHSSITNYIASFLFC